MLRSELSLNGELKTALKTEEALKSSASCSWKVDLSLPTVKVTVAMLHHLDTVNSLAWEFLA